MARKITTCIMSVLLWTLSMGVCLADTVGTVISVKDGAFALRDGKTIPLTLKAGVERGDVLQTNTTGKVQIFFNDDTTVTLGPNARLEMQDFVNEGKEPVFKAHLLEGMARVITGKIVESNPKGFHVTTPESTVGIRGTILVIRSREGNTSVFVESTLKTVLLNEVVVPQGFKASNANLSPSPITPADLKTIEAEVGGATPTQSSSASDSDSGSGDSSSGSGDSGGADSAGGVGASAGGTAASAASSASAAAGAGPSSTLAMASSPGASGKAASFAAINAKLRQNTNPPEPTPAPPGPGPMPSPRNNAGTVTGSITAGSGSNFITPGTVGILSFNFNLTTGQANNGQMSMTDSTNNNFFSVAHGSGTSASGTIFLQGFSGSATVGGATKTLNSSSVTGDNGSWGNFAAGNAASGTFNLGFSGNNNANGSFTLPQNTTP